MHWLGNLGIVLLLLAVDAAHAEDLQRIVLRDGSEIVAEVRSLEAGTYTLRSPSLGEIRIPQRSVERIERGGGAGTASAPSAPGAGATDLQGLQLQMLSDPAVVDSLVQLQASPEMQAILNDPEILQAVANGDLEALNNNPKMQKLMNDPAVRRLTGQLTESAP